MNEESFESLERKKILAEIKNLSRPPLKTPAFWAPVITLFIAMIVYAYLWKSGIFDEKQAHINFVTDTLTTRAKYIEGLITKSEDSLIDVRNDKSELVRQNNILKDSIKKIKGDLRILDSVKKTNEGSLSETKRQIGKLLIENRRLFVSDSIATFAEYRWGKAASNCSLQNAGLLNENQALNNQNKRLKDQIRLIKSLSDPYTLYVKDAFAMISYGGNTHNPITMNDVTNFYYRINTWVEPLRKAIDVAATIE